jgi:CheY-like chemotaxis protein
MAKVFKHVMVVDDDENTILICKIRLDKTHFCEHVIEKMNGFEALAYFENQLNLPAELQEIPSIIFLDLNMPIVDGWNFIKEFGEKYQRHFPHCAIFVLSSTLDPEETERASFEPLIYGFIHKPLTNETLIKLQNSRILQDEFQIKID